MKAAAEHLTPVTLELGGKSPTIVCADADIDVAARRIVWGKLLNAGQTCIAPDYVLAEREVRDRLVDAMVRQLDSFYGTDRKASPDLARIVDGRHHGRLMGLLGSSGGTVVVGGEADLTERYVAPTIVVDPDLDSDLMQQEIFGPILPVLAVDSVEDAIAFVNDRPKPLALYVFSRSEQIADRILARTSSGGACVNHTLVHIVPDSLPFGGVGPSGMGSYHGKAGFDTFSHHRSVLRKPTFPDPAILYPPYKGVKEKLVRLVFK
jgi:aldehyde dehydrogenase (NAD+)